MLRQLRTNPSSCLDSKSIDYIDCFSILQKNRLLILNVFVKV